MYVLDTLDTSICDLEKLYPTSDNKQKKDLKKKIIACKSDFAKSCNISIKVLNGWLQFKSIILKKWCTNMCHNFRLSYLPVISSNTVILDMYRKIKKKTHHPPSMSTENVYCISCLIPQTMRDNDILQKCTTCLNLVHPTAGCSRYALTDTSLNDGDNFIKTQLSLYCMQCLEFKRCECNGLFVKVSEKCTACKWTCL